MAMVVASVILHCSSGVDAFRCCYRVEVVEKKMAEHSYNEGQCTLLGMIAVAPDVPFQSPTTHFKERLHVTVKLEQHSSMSCPAKQS